MHIYPIVIFIRYKSAKHIKWVSGPIGFLLGLGLGLEQYYPPLTLGMYAEATLAKLSTSSLFGHKRTSREPLALSAELPSAHPLSPRGTG